MNIGLLKDGTYTLYKKIDKVMDDLSELKYMIFDISTSLKGPVHTLVKPKYISNEKLDCSVDITVLYASFDCPSSDTTTIQYNLPIDKISNRYNIYPLIKQMWDFNYYKDYMDIVDTALTIVNISLKIGNNIIEINEDISENEIEKIFKSYKIITNVISLKEKHIILYKNKWFLSKTIPNKFDFILYNLKTNESLYLLSYNQYKRFEDIYSFSIQMFDRWHVEDYDNITYGENYDYIDPDNYIDSDNLTSILESCLYFPQYIELEKYIYHNKMGVVLNIETSVKNFSLLVSEKEFVEYPIKVFDIINKIIQM